MMSSQPIQSSIVEFMLSHPAELAEAHRIAFPATPAKGGLTSRQRDLLAFIRSYSEEHGTTPSFDEMKDALGLRSKSGVARLVAALEERRFITRRGPNLARSVVLLERTQ